MLDTIGDKLVAGHRAMAVNLDFDDVVLMDSGVCLLDVVKQQDVGSHYFVWNEETNLRFGIDHFGLTVGLKPNSNIEPQISNQRRPSWCCFLMGRSMWCVDFAGFKGEEYHSAVKVFGPRISGFHSCRIAGNQGRTVLI